MVTQLQPNIITNCEIEKEINFKMWVEGFLKRNKRLM